MHHQARKKAKHYLIALLPIAALAAAINGRLLPVSETNYQKIVAAHRGKVVLVNFWATWCEPCREEMPFLASLENRLRDRGLVLIAISADEPEQEADALAFLKKTGIRFPAYLKSVKDNDRFIPFVDAKWSGALPASFLFDRRGAKAGSFVGETAPEKIETAVRKLL